MTASFAARFTVASLATWRVTHLPLVAARRQDLPLVWLALSGAACLLERATEARAAV